MARGHKLHPRSFLITGTEYLPVYFVAMAILWLIRVVNFRTISDYRESYEPLKFGKVVIFYVPTCPILITYTYTNMYCTIYTPGMVVIQWRIYL